ncbi:MAG TPA: hypothetical protein VJ925_14120, partial [Longimicrobiales bacterium]|nr:hypothetical protein [Longimicrobiales bacterium]
LELYRASGALDRVAPALAAAPDPLWSAAVDRVARLSPDDPVLRTVALVEVALGGDGGGVDRTALAEGVATWMRGLRFSNADMDRTVGLLAGPGLPPEADASDGDVRRWLAAVGPEQVADRVRLVEAAIESASDRPGHDPAGDGPESAVRARLDRARAEFAAGPPLTVGDLAIGGRDLIRLGLKPGPHFGELLDRLLERVLEDPRLNTADALVAEVERMVDPESTDAGP